MGIVYSLIRVSPETVDALRDNPRHVAEFVYGDAALYQAPKPGLLRKLFGAKQAEVGAPVPARRDGDEVDLDKSWHIIHYLLTGSEGASESALNIIADERDKLAEIDLGLGVPFVIDAKRVAEVSSAMSQVSDDGFLAGLAPSQMPLESLYLGNSVAEDPDEMGDYALEYLHILRDFLRDATENGDAVITYYS